MRYSEIKELYDSLDREEIELVLNNLGSNDFSNNNYRFIKEADCESIAIEQYEGDAYMLGCFNADFIADNTSLSYDIVKALQEGEQFESIGQHILDNDNIGDMMAEYIRLDGYGHVFSSYDGNYDEITIDDENYIFFRI